MQLHKLRIRNFLGIGEATLTFDKQGLVMVTGINHDSPAASSNGSGKSSLFEAVYYALYGKTKRGINGDAVINLNAKKDGCLVDLEFDKYLIQRYRKDATMGTGLSLYEDDGGCWKDISKGTIRDTQALIESLISMSELTFSKIAYFGQDDIRPFAELTDSELKTVFEQALGISVLSDYHQKAKEKLAASKALQTNLEGMVLSSEVTLDNNKEMVRTRQEFLDHIKASAATHKDGLEREIITLQAEGKELNDRIKTLTEQIDKASEAMGSTTGKLTQLKELRAKAGQAISQTIVGKTAIATKKEAAAKQYLTLENQAKDLTKMVGQPCGECGRPYDVATLSPRRILINKQQSDLTAFVKSMNEELEAQTGKLEHLKESQAKVDAAIDAMNAELIKLKEIEAQRKLLDDLRNQSVELTKRGMTLHSQYVCPPDLARIAMAEKELAEATATMEATQEQLANYDRQLAALKTDVDLNAMLVDVLGNGGMKSLVFDNCTPALNTLVARNLSALNPDIEVEISTLARLKSGELRDRFQVKVKNKSGAGSYGASSGGEKTIVNAAIALAFNQLVRTMAKGSANLLWLDEPFENLDDDHSERVVDLISGMASGIGNVFLVSHNNAVRSLVADTITVEKRGGMATIK